MSQQDINLDILSPAEEPKAEELLLRLKERDAADAQALDVPLPEEEEELPTAAREKHPRKEEKTADEESRNLRDTILSWVDEEDVQLSSNAWKEVFTGLGLVAIIRHNWKFLILLIAFIVVYVNLGYQIRDAIVENDRLNQEVLDRRYKALTQSSELRERTLRSRIEQQLADTTLRTTTERPYQLPVERESVAP